MGELFLQMLPDSGIASCFGALCGTKIGYMVMYGLAQYFRFEILQGLRPPLELDLILDILISLIDFLFKGV